jgi:UDP-3-O-[3-hydroxymyristoyl] N-acetylglucosamine deacetylase/3-hydroxyacyl-[acyl-carrier-protein] dehydratase
VLQQQTIKQAVSYEGMGLHSGNRVKMTFLPAEPNTGLRFRRTDLEGKPEVEARVENVTETNRSTTLGKGNVRIHTVEHVLASFAGYNIDNAIIEIDANEPPIADGSSRAYCEMLDKAGVVPQTEKREPYRVTEPIQVQQGETVISIFPSDTLKITCTSAGKGGRFTQFYSTEVNQETWKKELSHARTFCYFEEIEFLIKNGLIKGGSLENAVVIRDDAVLTTEPLRYPEEFVRHKMLDILGDVTLLGRPVVGHIIAVKPSHGSNCELTKAILSQIRKPLVQAQTFTPPPEQPAAKPAAPAKEKAKESKEVAHENLVQDGACLDTMQVMKVLPHRYPFLMVDRVTKIDGYKIVAEKYVTMNEQYFQGHFPGHPVMPGVLQLEAIAQVAGILMLKQAENAGKIAYFMAAESVKWRKPVRPGSVVVIDVELTKWRGKIGKAKGVCSVAGEVVSEAEVTFMVLDP